MKTKLAETLQKKCPKLGASKNVGFWGIKFPIVNEELVVKLEDVVRANPIIRAEYVIDKNIINIYYYSF